MKEEESKYQSSKKGKIALTVAIIALTIAILSIILGMIGIKMGVIMIIVAIGANLIAMIGVAVLVVDNLKHKRIKNPEKLSKEFEKVGYFALGIAVGIMIGFIF